MAARPRLPVMPGTWSLAPASGDTWHHLVVEMETVRTVPGYNRKYFYKSKIRLFLMFWLHFELFIVNPLTLR